MEDKRGQRTATIRMAVLGIMDIHGANGPRQLRQEERSGVDLWEEAGVPHGAQSRK